MKILSQIRAYLAQIRAYPAQIRASPAQIRASPAQIRASPAQIRASPAQRRASPAQRSVPPTQRSVPPAQRSVPPTQRSVPPAQRSVPPTQRSAYLGGNSFSITRQGASKEWRTPIRHAHGEPMKRENRFSWSPHGPPIRRSALLGTSRQNTVSLELVVSQNNDFSRMMPEIPP